MGEIEKAGEAGEAGEIGEIGNHPGSAATRFLTGGKWFRSARFHSFPNEWQMILSF